VRGNMVIEHMVRVSALVVVLTTYDVSHRAALVCVSMTYTGISVAISGPIRKLCGFAY